MSGHNWVGPLHSRTAVDQAGIRIGRVDLSDALAPPDQAVLDNWRTSHAFPLNTFQTRLRRRARVFDADSLVVQRQKRAPTIRRKLQRFPQMRMTQMQDIGGCRAVVGGLSILRALEHDYVNSRMRHMLVRHDDYLDGPSTSGYRGVHLVYKYRSSQRSEFDGLLVEIQLRTRIQHSWATAVEAVGTFLGAHLKEGAGPGVWLDYFRDVSAGFAHLESTQPVPGASTDLVDLAERIVDGTERLSPAPKLAAVALAMNEIVEGPSGRYFLVDLDMSAPGVTVTPFRGSEQIAAAAAYAEAEERVRGDPNRDVVLVAADSVLELKRGFPNYFADVTEFTSSLRDMIHALGRALGYDMPPVEALGDQGPA